MPYLKKYSAKDQENLSKAIAWINLQEFFWLRDLRGVLGCADSDARKNKNNEIIQMLIAELKKKEYLQCSEVRKGERQYVLMKQINKDDLSTGSRT